MLTMFRAKFTDITHEAGITFSHVNGAYGAKLLPKRWAAAWRFYDYDKRRPPGPALHHLASGRPRFRRRAPPPAMALYHNDGHGHFTMYEGSGPGREFLRHGRAVGDYDNNGLPDVFVPRSAAIICSTMTAMGVHEVTQEAGVGGSTTLEHQRRMD